MAAKKVLVVFGATGVQGGSVVKAMLGDAKLKESWAVRGVTRDVSKPSAKALETMGAETIAADLNDAATLKDAVKGAYAVFAVTNYWETKSAETELKQGKAIADAAKDAGVQHYIWSSLMNVTQLSKGALRNVEHFDSKAAVEDYVKQIGIPATFFMPGFYMSNLPGGSLRQGPPNNDWALSLPIPASTPVPLLDTAKDTGSFVKGILLNREKCLGKRVLGATDYYTLKEILDQFRELYPQAGKNAKNVELPHQLFKDIMTQSGADDKSAEEMLENMRLMNEFGYFGGASLKESHEVLVDKLTTWKEFMLKSRAFEDLK